MRSDVGQFCSLASVLAELGEGPCSELETGWSESLASLPQGPIDWLQADYISEHAAYAGLANEEIASLIETARTIELNPPLRAFAWHFRRIIFQGMGPFGKFPALTLLGERWGEFYLILGVSAVAIGREGSYAIGIPEKVIHETMNDLVLHAWRFKQMHGKLGLLPEAMNWFRGHSILGLHRLGRLQFVIKPYRFDYYFFRNRLTDATIAIAGGGIKFDAQGLVYGTSSPNGQDGMWESVYEEKETVVTGSPIRPDGYAERRMVQLEKTEWEEKVSKGTQMLEVHIPTGGNMSLESCCDSLSQAIEFFPRYYPERIFQGFCCTSWIFNPQLEYTLSSESNLVRFMREVYLLPVGGNGKGGLGSVFFTKEIDPKTAPRETSLQRALLDLLEKTPGLRGGSMVFLKEDVSKFGSQVYRSSWEAIRSEF